MEVIVFLMCILLFINLAIIVILIGLCNFILKSSLVKEVKTEDKIEVIRPNRPEMNLIEVPTPYFLPSPQKLDKGF